MNVPTPLSRSAAHAAFSSLGLISVAFYAAIFVAVLAAGELFHRLGFDWTLFYAQAMAVRAGAGERMYDLQEIDRHLQPLLAYYGGPAVLLNTMPVPYPPWFAAAVVPFTLVPAPVGLALWLLASILAALFLAYRVGQLLPRLGWIGGAVAILASIPVAWGLFMGQPAVLLAVAVSELFISLRGRQDFRAGLWLGVLLLKPQYALLFGLLLLWKRRYRAVAGAVASGAALVIVGLLAAGPAALMRFPSVLGEMSDLHNAAAGPNLMINWRAIVVALRPGIAEDIGVPLVWTLSIATMLVSLLLWRGRWDPESPTFGARFGVVALAALVGSYHSHLHGAALLIVPLAAAWASQAVQPLTRATLLVAIYAPTLFVLWSTGVVNRLAVSADPNTPIWTVWPAALPAFAFAAALALMWIDVSREREAAPRVAGSIAVHEHAARA